MSSCFVVRPCIAQAQTPVAVPVIGTVWARVNGEAIGQDEYIRTLERQQVGGNAPSISAVRLAMDNLVGNRVILETATKESTLPSAAVVERFYKTQKGLYEHQFPGRSYEDNLREQGTLPDDVRADMRAQLAETNFYIKRLNVGQGDLRDAYDKARGQIGIPERVQLRFVVVPDGSPEFDRVKKQLEAKADFLTLAREVNPPQLRATAGAPGNPTPVAAIPPTFRDQITGAAENAIVGPVDFQPAQNGGPATKAWVRVEKKLPGYSLPYEEAALIVARQLVQQRLAQPENVKYRNELITAKINARFEPTDPRYTAIWEALKRDGQALLSGANKSSGG